MVHGTIIRPWLGVSGVTVTRDVAAYYDLSVDKGVLVARVMPGSPAERARIIAGDVILSLADSAINSTEDLHRVIQERKVGDKVEILILRDNRRWIVEAELDRMP